MGGNYRLPVRQARSAWLLLGSLLIGGGLLACEPEKSQEGKRLVIPAGRGEKFDVTRHIIPLKEIRGGGPPKDGIPALTNPKFVSMGQADERLRDGDKLIGLEFNGEAKAYPIRILNWHEIVNDTVGGRPVAVTW